MSGCGGVLGLLLSLRQGGAAASVGGQFSGDVVLGPAQQRGGDLSDLVSSSQTVVAVLQVQAHAVNDDVVQVQGALVGDGPSNLSLQEGGGGL